MTAQDTLDYYAEPGPLTSAGPHEAALKELPAAGPELFEAVRGLIAHERLLDLHGIEPAPVHQVTTHFRSVGQILGHLLADGRPLTEARPPAERLVGTCRHFTLVTVAALRANGVPARARCGFAAYFPIPNMEDHWVAEYWDADRSRWVLADVQIDDEAREAFGVDFRFDDVPRDQFAVAGRAWRECRAGRDDAGRYGFSFLQEFGAWWIAGNLVRDVAALAKLELLPWDGWGAMPPPRSEVDPANLELFDELAAITADPDTAAEARGHHGRDDRLRVPDQVFNFLRQAHEPVITPA